MTVPATPRRAGPYDGTGAQTAFPFSFKAFDESDVRVVELDLPTNVESDATLNTDYTVALNPDQESTPGGTVNYLAAPTADKKITLIGDLPYEQPADLPDGGAYRAQQVEDALDRLAICMQQLKEITDRCAQVPVSSADASALFESINILAANLPTLQTVVANIADLVALANDIADVNTLAAISAQVQTVAAIAVQVVAVAAIAPEVAAVEGISADIQLVAANMAAILAAVADLPALAGKANSGDVTTSLLTTDAGSIIGRVAGGGAGALQKLTPAQVVALVRSSTGQAQGGADNDTLLSPLRLREALNASGSAPLYGVRAWARFSGTTTGTFAPVAGGNVSSITRNSAGVYTVNFSTAMPDANYAALVVAAHSGNNVWAQVISTLAGSMVVNTANMGGGGGTYTSFDASAVLVIVLR